MRISDWSSDVCSSDLADHAVVDETQIEAAHRLPAGVDRLRGQIIDLARQLTAGEIVAEGVRQILAGVADRELGRPRDRADRVLDFDVEPVGGKRQARADTARLAARHDRTGRRAFALLISLAAAGA